MSARWKITALLLIVVLLSTAGGVALGRCWMKAEYHRRAKPQAWNIEAMRTMERKLDLTPEQREHVQQILDAGVLELIDVRTETLAKTDVVIDRMVVQIEPLLTSEQRAAFLKLREERAKPSLEMLFVKPRPEATPAAKP
jgi:Spy/CpxP family protein refolding chaperone